MAGRVSAVVAEVVSGLDGPAKVSFMVDEVLIAAITRSPTTPTGAAVTQHIVEVVAQAGTGVARVTQHVTELVVGLDPAPGGGSGSTPTATTHTFGYAV